MADDFHSDPELEAALRSQSGGDVELTDAFGSVLSRSASIRRRRLAVTTSAVAVVAVGAVALLPRGGGRDLDPADQVPGVELPGDDTSTTAPGTPTGTPDDQSDDGSDDGSDDSRDEAADGSSAATSSVPGGGATTTEASAGQSGTSTAPSSTGEATSASSTTVGTTTSPTTTTSPSTTSSTTPPSTSSPTTTSPTTTSPTSTTQPIAPFTRTYDSAGGSITVSWNGSAFTLQSVAPAPGFEAEIENEEPLRIRVRFRGEPDDSRIEVRISDGVLVEEIS